MTGMLGGILCDKGLWLDVAKQKDEEALQIYTALNYKAGIARSHRTHWASLKGKRANYQNAIQHFLTALAYILKALTITAGIVSTYLKST